MAIKAKPLTKAEQRTFESLRKRQEATTIKSLQESAIAAYANLKSPVEESPIIRGVEETLSVRGARYGDFRDHAGLADRLIQVMENHRPLHSTLQDSWQSNPWYNLEPNQRQALRVIADKIARILNGDADYEDNWHDIQGYAKLVEDKLGR